MSDDKVKQLPGTERVPTPEEAVAKAHRMAEGISKLIAMQMQITRTAYLEASKAGFDDAQALELAKTQLMALNAKK